MGYARSLTVVVFPALRNSRRVKLAVVINRNDSAERVGNRSQKPLIVVIDGDEIAVAVFDLGAAKRSGFPDVGHLRAVGSRNYDRDVFNRRVRI